MRKMAAKPEEYFGSKAGVVWKALSENGPVTLAVLKRKTGLANGDVYVALGWLAREGKIKIIGEKPLHYKFALNDSTR